jgi:hypothetical protein
MSAGAEDSRDIIMVTVHLPPDIESKLRAKAAETGKTVEELLGWLAESWVAANGTSVGKPTERQVRPDQWVNEWRAWASSHASLPSLADDSRESIYSGRGE